MRLGAENLVGKHPFIKGTYIYIYICVCVCVCVSVCVCVCQSLTVQIICLPKAFRFRLLQRFSILEMK